MDVCCLVKKTYYIMKSFTVIACMLLFMSAAVAQEQDVYKIIGVHGTVKDKRSGKKLEADNIINLHTELQFGSLLDRAILMNSENIKYILELPKSSFINSRLTVASSQALIPAISRMRPPALITGVRTAAIEELSPQTLREYFWIDTFTVVGSKFTLPVNVREPRKYELLLRYKTGRKVVEYVSSDFTVSKHDLKIKGHSIPDCQVLLKEGDKTVPVICLSLFFIEKTQLFVEFEALLNALNRKSESNDATREILRQYCIDIYGMIDISTQEMTINDFLALHQN